MTCNWPYTCSRCGKADRILETGGACATCVWFGPEADMPANQIILDAGQLLLQILV
ncbi:MAG: hypothetical protein HFE88_10725 [Acutalibacter sp.]|nr:hypothetical protein [Acutalibacter sp.]